MHLSSFPNIIVRGRAAMLLLEQGWSGEEANANYKMTNNGFSELGSNLGSYGRYRVGDGA